MTIQYPLPGDLRRPRGPRDPGDAWVVAADGTRYWGRFGAAGLLAYDPARGILMQHRVEWSHHGGTWGLPGGARHQDESARDGALREAQEEAGVPDGATRPRLLSVLDLQIWSYTTVLADVTVPFEPTISDPESLALEWVPAADVERRPLHPGFADAWPMLREQLDVRPALVVDAANVVGSVPDGWWRDRAGAAAQLIGKLAVLAAAGVAADVLELPGHAWYPEISVVVEGQAKAVRVAGGRTGEESRTGEEAGAAADGRIGGGLGVDTPTNARAAVHVVRAPGVGDDAIVEEARAQVAAGRTVTVVTSDRELRSRCERAGATVRGARWLRDLL